MDSEKSIHLGKAAHITAASKNGPRFDSTLTPAQRRSIENGIYLCSSCAEMIDKNNGLDFPEALLRTWKVEHENWVRTKLNKSATCLIPNIQIAQIRIASNHCLWEIETEERLLGTQYEIGFHQLPTFTWKKGEEQRDQRVSDPILDITLINTGFHPLLFTAVGFEAIDVWSKLKGLPISAKVKRSHGYELKVEEFIIGKKTFLQFQDPIYMSPTAPYRFSLRLQNYAKVLPGNESGIKLAFKIGEQCFLSNPIYLGLYGEK